MRDLPALLDRLEEAGGPTDPVSSADGWELVLAENVAYLVDDQRRWQALADLRHVVGLDPGQILAAPAAVLVRVVVGARPTERAERLRVLTRLGYAEPARSYATGYRQAQAAASTWPPAEVPPRQRAYQLLRRHGQAVCRGKEPACASCVIAGDCPSAGHPPPLY